MLPTSKVSVPLTVVILTAVTELGTFPKPPPKAAPVPESFTAWDEIQEFVVVSSILIEPVMLLAAKMLLILNPEPENAVAMFVLAVDADVDA